MLSTDLSTFFALLIGVFGLIVVFLAVSFVKLREWCAMQVDFVRNHNAKSLSLARIAEVEATLTDLLDAYDALLKSHKRLRAKIGMREVREKRKTDPKEVDLSDEGQKADLKARLRLESKQRGLL